MSPTARLTRAEHGVHLLRDRGAGRRCTRGGGIRVGAGRGYTGYPAGTLRDPIFSIYLASGPTYGQMNPKLRYFMRFLRIGSRIDLELTRIDPQNDPPQTGPEMTSDDPQMTLRYPMPENRCYLTFY